SAASDVYKRQPPPVKDLDAIPAPDYSDFPWDAYPNRIAPLITGRGCGWGKCSFCSDITSTIGRTYRSRSLDNVLDEVTLHSERYNTKLFVFTDLKLNSDQSVWKGLHKNMQRVAPGAQWVCAIHIPADGGGGLTEEDLKQAAESGLVRLTTGFESGSMKVLGAMNKGTNLEQMSQTLKNADAAGISVRVTMIVGYPGETADDVVASARYLEDHVNTIERVMFNRLQMMTGTILHRGWQSHPSRYPDLKKVKPNHRLGQLQHEFKPSEKPEYLAAVDRLLAAVHKINLKPLKPSARQFEGVM
ncbi:MAG: radical SAM protein, partial [Nannocystaceae bacterium]|nr:radical SAM protein [Nannocystaceae bacterium]